jgi:hypothetical protein
MLLGATLERHQHVVDVADQQVGGAHQLHIETGVEHVGRRHALVHEPRLRSDQLGEMREEGDDVVLDLAFDRVDAGDVERRRVALGPDRLGCIVGDHAERSHGIGGVGLDLEPDAVARLRLPDRHHLRPAVARDHVLTLPLRAPSRLRRGAR